MRLQISTYVVQFFRIDILVPRWIPKAYQAILAIKQASESKKGWSSMLEAEQLKIQGSKQKVGKGSSSSSES